ncbi:hypothetical protein BDB00DRAFT_829080 [Zychaea mexicana]|uniref:uncharacterized protein n=1 Tax=Zychaea mexicana TaxID=64656 RepID=UPI0022FDF98B|nr:uncharacterized protein BDB00DRAFT_829080 [Zychaea mexicana]KAI9492265.1 hypothetical protein BDB00DRAFT_829080 [Zychaea mexicana]
MFLLIGYLHATVVVVAAATAAAATLCFVVSPMHGRQMQFLSDSQIVIHVLQNMFLRHARLLDRPQTVSCSRRSKQDASQ